MLKAPSGWALRRFRDGKRMTLVGLPKTVVVIPHAAISNAFVREGIIQRRKFEPLDKESLVSQLADACAFYTAVISKL